MPSKDELNYSVPDVNCQHCVDAVTDEVEHVSGVESVVVDVESKLVTVKGRSIDDSAFGGATVAGSALDPDPDADETHPSAGRYRLFLQFKHDGRVQTVAFTQETGLEHGH